MKDIQRPGILRALPAGLAVLTAAALFAGGALVWGEGKSNYQQDVTGRNDLV